jgi:hypothetical protein
MVLTMRMTWKHLLIPPGKLLQLQQQQQKVQSYSLQQSKAVLLQQVVSHQLLLVMQHSQVMWCCHQCNQMLQVLGLPGIKLVQLG